MSFSATPFKSARKKKLSDNVFVDDGPLEDFLELINDTKPEEWKRRTDAFSSLVESIVEADEDSDMWYNDPKSIRRLFRPLTALLKDARSSVVKSASISLVLLYQKRPGAYGKLLFKELMPVILDVHGQTVNMIRVSVQEMTTQVLPLVPCKASMPCMLERLQKSKSRTVRQACTLYLRLALETWTEPDYLGEAIVIQVGTAFVLALRDASVAVRQEAKLGLKLIQGSYSPELFEQLIENPKISRDVRIQKYLRRMANDEEDAQSATTFSFLDESSVASRASKRSVSSYRRFNSGAPVASPSPQRASRRTLTSPFGLSGRSSPSHRDGSSASSVPTSVVVGAPAIPTTKASSSSMVPKRTNMGPPMRVTASNQNNHASNNHADFDDKDSPNRVLDFENHNGTLSSPTPFVLGVQELKKQAKTNRSRRSSLLQEKWRQSSMSNLMDNEGSSSSLLISSSSRAISKEETVSNGHGSTAAPPDAQEPIPSGDGLPSDIQTVVKTPEHVLIAQQVLEAHQNHIDSIMETIRLEMETMRDFEANLKQKTPSDEDVITYFECVGLCLSQRTASGQTLEQEMNRIIGMQHEKENA